jgi:hypothetical protein
MNHKPLSFFFSDYDFKNFEATNADQGFVENHINVQYETDERPILRLVRRFVRELSAHPTVQTDFFFDAGSHEGMWRRKEAYRVNVDGLAVLKINIEMGEDAGTYDMAPATYARLGAVSENFQGKHFGDQKTGLEYMYCFSQIRNLVSQMSNKCVFKVDEDHSGFALTIMPLTEGLAKYQSETAKGDEEPEATGTFIKIQLRNPLA